MESNVTISEKYRKTVQSPKHFSASLRSQGDLFVALIYVFKIALNCYGIQEHYLHVPRDYKCE